MNGAEFKFTKRAIALNILSFEKDLCYIKFTFTLWTFNIDDVLGHLSLHLLILKERSVATL